MRYPAMTKICSSSAALAMFTFFILLGCAGGHSALVPSGASSSTQDVHLEGGDPGQQHEVAFAIHESDRIYSDPDFWTLVRERALWLRAQEETHPSRPGGTVEISGNEIAAYLSPLRPIESSYSLVRVFRWYNPWRWIFAGTVNAETASCSTIRILRRNIGSVDSLVNTISHENTHVPGMGDGELGCNGPGREQNRFTDTPPDDAAKAWLVSYVIGDLAECYYRSEHDSRSAMACFGALVDGNCRSRLYEECCATTASKAVIEIRKKADRCRPYLGDGHDKCERLTVSCMGHDSTG